MKLLSIAGRNLASLAGDFLIDFTEPPLSIVGVFAILGPTGSGKSTILDALSLALYGKTPRSAKSGDAQVPAGDETWTAQDTRHIVRRGASEANAVVRFEAKGEIYEAAWRCQKGVRGDRAGKLNPPTIKLRRGEELLAHGVEAHSAKVEALTGLNFDNFCRSVLLAQGEFAAFLQAKAPQRAKVLEALTDPQGIYRKLSIAAHKRGSEAQGKLKQARDDVAIVQVMSPEEVAANEDVVRKKTAEAKECAARCDAMRVEQQAWADLRKAEAVVGAARAARDDQVTASAAEEPKRRWVSEVTEALPLREPRSRRDRAKTAAVEAEADLATTGKLLDAATVEHDGLAVELQTAQGDVTDCDAAFEATKYDRERARRLDDERVQADRDRAAKGMQLADLDREKTQLDDRGGKLNARVSELAASEATQRRWVDGHPTAKVLAERRDAWRGPLRRYVSVRAELEGMQRQLVVALGDLTLRETDQATAQGAVVTAEQAEAIARLDCETANKLAIELSSLVSVENTRRLEGQKRALDDLSRVGLGLTDRRTLLAKLRVEEQDGKTKVAELVVQRDAQPVGELEKELERVEKRRLLAEAQASVERQRINLKTGEPCAVCGSVDHPWASPDAIVDADDARAKHAAVVVKLDAARKAQQSARDALARAEALVDSAARDRSKREVDVASEELAWASAASECGVSPSVSFQVLPAAVGERVDAVATQLAKLGADDRAAREAVVAERVKRAALDAATAALGQGREAVVQATRAHDAAKNAADRLRAGVTASADQLVVLWREAESAFAAIPDARTSFEGDPAGTLATWDALVVGHDAARDALAVVAAEAARLEADRAAHTTDTKVWEAKRSPVAAELAKLEATLLEALGERAELFEGRPIDEVEHAQGDRKAKLAEAVREAIAKAEAVRDRRNEFQGQRRTQLQTLERARGTQQAEEVSYVKALASAGIDEAEAARRLDVSDGELEVLRERLEALKRACEVASRALQSAEETLVRLASSKPDRDEAILARDVEAESRVHEDALRDRGVFGERLAQNMLRLAERDDKQRVLEALQSSEGVWGELAEVIGHNAGDTLAIFAQSLSLEVLLGAANEQLRQLQPRYAIERLEKASEGGLPLEIAIVDREFADTLRPLSTLSGGEKFLVSLALALGLSRLASRNVPLGTMFIDEGFGTLDPETLSLAMGVLDTLQQRGTKVGVISHVGEVALRIQVQIKVMKQADGPSRVQIVP